ncbi:unnamed protein product [Paramecium primaurelia]|uniref:Uncharacterized protein n=1 Tax=Paramecium primaurelia TaxID=5886 RepID=A0A8S1Q174_PARPR|nr:unnamed protein product [Paramecium primaurelia]
MRRIFQLYIDSKYFSLFINRKQKILKGFQKSLNNKIIISRQIRSNFRIESLQGDRPVISEAEEKYGLKENQMVLEELHVNIEAKLIFFVKHKKWQLNTYLSLKKLMKFLAPLERIALSLNIQTYLSTSYNFKYLQRAFYIKQNNSKVKNCRKIKLNLIIQCYRSIKDFFYSSQIFIIELATQKIEFFFIFSIIKRQVRICQFQFFNLDCKNQIQVLKYIFQNSNYFSIILQSNFL